RLVSEHSHSVVDQFEPQRIAIERPRPFDIADGDDGRRHLVPELAHFRSPLLSSSVKDAARPLVPTAKTKKAGPGPAFPPRSTLLPGAGVAHRSQRRLDPFHQEA